LAPVPMFYYPDQRAAIHYSAESSRTTHGAAECLEACRLLAGIISRALAGHSKDSVLMDQPEALTESTRIAEIARGEYCHKTVHTIRGSGYVVESLEAALWCFLHTSTFESAILKAANLGDDADTTAAVCGQVAGAYYGASSIPSHWLNRLAMRDEITALADQLLAARPSA
jgi:ADP-ribosyl-[dinitrogen reductase] hydrolase